MKPISNEDVSQQLEAGKEEDACSLKKRKNSDDKTFDINKTVKRLRLYVAKSCSIKMKYISKISHKLPILQLF